MSGFQDYILPVSDSVTSALGGHQHVNNKGQWSGAFTIMAWLHSATNLTGHFTLELYYQDYQGEHCIEIDQCMSANKNTILLTNRVVLSFNRIPDMAQLRVISHTEQRPTISILESSVIPVTLSAEKYLQQKAL